MFLRKLKVTGLWRCGTLHSDWPATVQLNKACLRICLQLILRPFAEISQWQEHHFRCLRGLGIFSLERQLKGTLLLRMLNARNDVTMGVSSVGACIPKVTTMNKTMYKTFRLWLLRKRKLTGFSAWSSIMTQKEANLRPVLSPSLEQIQHPLPVAYSTLWRWNTWNYISANVRCETAPTKTIKEKKWVHHSGWGHKSLNTHEEQLCMW